MAEDTGKQKTSGQLHGPKSSEGDVDNSPANLVIIIMSFAFSCLGTVNSGFGEKKRELESRSERQETARKSNRDTMIQLPSDSSLPLWPALLQRSGRNVAQIRVSARWGG